MNLLKNIQSRQQAKQQPLKIIGKIEIPNMDHRVNCAYCKTKLSPKTASLNGGFCDDFCEECYHVERESSSSS